MWAGDTSLMEGLRHVLCGAAEAGTCSLMGSRGGGLAQEKPTELPHAETQTWCQPCCRGAEHALRDSWDVVHKP